VLLEASAADDDDEEVEVSNRIRDRLREVWAERGASCCCCCWEGLVVAVEAVMVSTVFCVVVLRFALVEGMENGGRRRQEVGLKGRSLGCRSNYYY
jgi:hypothetical protein